MTCSIFYQNFLHSERSKKKTRSKWNIWSYRFLRKIFNCPDERFSIGNWHACIFSDCHDLVRKCRPASNRQRQPNQFANFCGQQRVGEVSFDEVSEQHCVKTHHSTKWFLSDNSFGDHLCTRNKTWFVNQLDFLGKRTFSKQASLVKHLAISRWNKVCQSVTMEPVVLLFLTEQLLMIGSM